MLRKIITISRQFGSGGSAVGQKLAEMGGVPFYDKEILMRAARESGVHESLFEEVDEKPSNSLLYSLVMTGQPFANNYMMDQNPFNSDRLFALQAETIEKIASEGPCVIVGRCADYILRHRQDVLSVFIHATMEDRIQRICRKYEVGQDEARSRIKRTDKRRASYHTFYAEGAWGAVSTYDLSINTSKLGIEGATKLILQTAELFS